VGASWVGKGQSQGAAACGGWPSAPRRLYLAVYLPLCGVGARL